MWASAFPLFLFCPEPLTPEGTVFTFSVHTHLLGDHEHKYHVYRGKHHTQTCALTPSLVPSFLLDTSAQPLMGVESPYFPISENRNAPFLSFTPAPGVMTPDNFLLLPLVCPSALQHFLSVLPPACVPNLTTPGFLPLPLLE